MPSYRKKYEQYHLNRWVAGGATTWIDYNKWTPNARNYDWDTMDGELCYAGLDIGSTTDLTALSLVFPKEDGMYLLTKYWLPEDNIATRTSEDNIPYDVWRDNGWLSPTSGNTIDAETIIETIAELSSQYHIAELAFDPAFSFNIFPALQRRGIPCTEFRQTLTNYHPPSQEFEKLIYGGKLYHNNNPITNYCVSNVRVYRSYDGRCKPSKEYKQSSERIDGVVATIMALSCCIRKNILSVYEGKKTNNFEVLSNTSLSSLAGLRATLGI
jgi:phage terminase large subunit-like protein